MDAVKIDLPFTTLLIATVLTGLSAGICFIWTNTITPGIGKLEDLAYLEAFQHMNRVILNPLFFLVFFGPIFLIPAASYLLRDYASPVFGILLAASALYILGLGLVTIFGNVPLNEMLDKAVLKGLGTEDLSALRDSFETSWNRLHLIRTLSSGIAFTLLILVSTSLKSPFIS